MNIEFLSKYIFVIIDKTLYVLVNWFSRVLLDKKNLIQSLTSIYISHNNPKVVMRANFHLYVMAGLKSQKQLSILVIFLWAQADVH
jgi:hypothetical protein